MRYSGLVHTIILYIHIITIKQYKYTEFSYKYFIQQIYIHIFVLIITNRISEQIQNILLLLKKMCISY